jgi:triosephosphate isomerase
MRTPLVAGNWKMNLRLESAVALARSVREGLPGKSRAEVALIPPSCLLPAVAEVLRGSPLALGAQDLDPRPDGAVTGAVSGPMLGSVGCTLVLCGHSERRKLFGETPELVGEKVAAAHRAGLTPVLCVGEELPERQSGQAERIAGGQMEAGLGRLSAEQVLGSVIAYEPVWAIGTGVTARPADAQAMHAFLRAKLGSAYGETVAAGVRILYGGSVKPATAPELLGVADVDGFLVGGASLVAEDFLAIVRAAGV